METILIDYENIISDCSELFPKPEVGLRGEIGMVTFVSSHILSKMNSLPLGKERIEFLKSLEFRNSIQGVQFVEYNKKKNLCVYCGNERIEGVVKCLNNSLSGVRLWVSIPVKELEERKGKKLLLELNETGFGTVYRSSKTPFGKEIQDSICFVSSSSPSSGGGGRGGELREKINLSLQVENILKENKRENENKTCKVWIRIEPPALKLMRNCSIKKNNPQKQSNPQKEMTGELLVKEVMNNKQNILYLLDVDEKSVESGEEENVSVDSTRYNFHSHPEEAYARHSVSKAWPSITDYLGYLKLGNNTIVHCVATLEGLYVISFGSYWCNRLKEVDKNFVKKNYDYPLDMKLNIDSYIERVNKTLYKGFPIFVVKYFEWEEAGTAFSVYFSPTKEVCLYSQTSKELFEELHK